MERPFIIDAIVILPDHLHTLWTLPEGDADYSGRWRAIKSRFTHSLLASSVSLTRDNRGEYLLWQRRFWEHTIRDELDFTHHVDYCHWNPIKHGCVQYLADWPYSSFHRYVRYGLLPANWTGMIAGPDSEHGE
jgi:putative transposase